MSMEKFTEVDLTKEENVLVIASTYGEGEPPDMAKGFWDWLKADTAPKLENLRYSVLALGDTNYADFCQFGKNCDDRLAALGAKRVVDRKDCDVDYETPAAEWTASVFAALGDAHGANGINGANGSVAEKSEVGNQKSEITEGWSKKNPFPSKLIANRKLSGEGSGKDVRHCEISLAGSGLTYEVGDALGVYPTNCPQLVGEILTALGCDGEEAVKTPDGVAPLRLALTQHFDITKPSAEFLAAAAQRSPGSELAALIVPARKDDLRKWLYGREVIDVLASLVKPFSAAEFVALLKKIAPRLYSISSSLKVHADEVHLTIAAVRYESHGRARKGVASTFLADHAGDAKVPIFVQPSHGFKPPTNGDTPMIMVGPGTGIAPFRAFLEERLATVAKGRNWLFFGDQKRATDFLYQDQLEGWVKDGHLTRLDLAFSRDQAEKIYVQSRMIEAAAELWSWLEAGAHFYVCGDASRMAKDVDAALHRVIETAGGKSTEDAKAYVDKLKSDKRYQRDVY
jgi:sulfite reductase (NADPH) flavoprotein alpha-component